MPADLHTPETEDVSALVDELEEIDPDTIRTRVLNLATPPPPPLTDTKPTPRERALPIISVVVGAVITVAIVLVTVLTFASRVRTARNEAGAFLTGEGLVLAEFRRQTEAQLQEKDRTIMAALDRLSSLESERRALDELVAARVQQREGELVAELEAQLEAERDRLESGGMDAASVDQRIQEVRDEIAAEAAAELDAFKASLEREIRAQADSLRTEEEEARIVLAIATEERSEILEQSGAAERSLNRSESETLRSIDAARAGASPTNLSDGDAARRVAALESSLRTAEAENARLKTQVSELDSDQSELRDTIAGLQSREAGLIAEVTSLRSSLAGSDDGGTLAGRVADLDSEVASLRAQVESQRTLLEEARTDSGDARAEIETLETQIARLGDELSTARDQLAAAQSSTATTESRFGAVAQEARAQALRDAVTAVKSFEPGTDGSDVTRALGPAESDRVVAVEFVEELSILIAEAQRAVLDAQLEYRPLGTVSLTGSGSITVQRLVMISISDGMLAEVRRSTGNGTEVVARGTVGEVESQRFVVTITELSGSRAPAVGDQVFVAVPR